MLPISPLNYEERTSWDQPALPACLTRSIILASFTDCNWQ